MSHVADSDSDQLAIATIRTLCIDAVQQANSGHPGRPMAGIEQASDLGWQRYVGANGAVIGMDTFGASAPLKEPQTRFDFAPEAVVGIAMARLAAAAAG